MRIIGLEEHFVTADVLKAWDTLDAQWQDSSMKASAQGESARRLAELADDRFAAMDETGLDVQVLSLTAPGLHPLAPDDAVALQIDSNDLLADTIRAHPNRLQGFATLAPPQPRKRQLSRWSER